MKKILTIATILSTTQLANPQIIEKTTTVPKEKVTKREEGKRKFLEHIIDNNINTLPAFKELENYNKEWQLFTLSFSAYAFTNIAFQKETYQTQAIHYIEKTIQEAQKETLANNFGESMLYDSHLNMMIGAYKLLGGKKFEELHQEITEKLAKRIETSPIKNIPSYGKHGQIWPSDNSTAIASIHLYDQINNSKHQAVSDWTKWMKEQGMNKNGLPFSEIDFEGGKIAEPRGSAIAWTIIFSNYFDKPFSEKLYQQFEEEYFTSLMGLTAVKERKGEHAINEGDIDSGPIILGYGVAATGFALGAAKTAQDDETYNNISRLVELFSTTKDSADINHYKQFSPLSDALFTFFRTITPWDKKYLEKE